LRAFGENDPMGMLNFLNQIPHLVLDKSIYEMILNSLAKHGLRDEIQKIVERMRAKNIPIPCIFILNSNFTEIRSWAFYQIIFVSKIF
jgi:hypothetical protein